MGSFQLLKLHLMQLEVSPGKWCDKALDAFNEKVDITG